MATERPRQFRFSLSDAEWEALEYISAAEDRPGAELLRAFIVERYTRLRSPWLADLFAAADELRTIAARVRSVAQREQRVQIEQRALGAPRARCATTKARVGR